MIAIAETEKNGKHHDNTPAPEGVNAPLYTVFVLSAFSGKLSICRSNTWRNRVAWGTNSRGSLHGCIKLVTKVENWLTTMMSVAGVADAAAAAVVAAVVVVTEAVVVAATVAGQAVAPPNLAVESHLAVMKVALDQVEPYE